MSIYDKTADSLIFADVNELLTENAVENVRLEFKREVPNKEETLKKLSSLANTFGGYVIVGADEADKGGKLTGLPGVPPENNYKQQLIQWCYQGIYPPITPFVSGPLLTESDPSRVVYVIYVPESLETPHFLNDRKGAYVRIGDHSGRFDAKLAAYDELQHLGNRRALAVSRREALLSRAEERYDTFGLSNRGSIRPDIRANVPVFQLFICPAFPSAPFVSELELEGIMGDINLTWRQIGYPRQDGILTQHESVLMQHAASSRGPSLLEATIWGSLLYSQDIDIQKEVGADGFEGVHTASLGGRLLLFLKHAGMFYQRTGYQGPLIFQLIFKEMADNPWVIFVGSSAHKGPFPGIDDEVRIHHEAPTNRLTNGRNELWIDLMRSTFFARNWLSEASDDNRMNANLRDARSFNMWGENQ